jgi:hypothetical protein
MSDVKQIFAEKKFPTFITQHSVFKNYKDIKKIFPEIGLPNCEKEIEIDNAKEVRAAAKQMLGSLRQTVDRRIQTINRYNDKHPDAIGPKRKKKLENTIKLLTDVKDLISKQTAKCLTDVNGKITLNLPADVADIDNKMTFKSGEGLFRVYNKLNETLREGHFLPMGKLEDFEAFKDFSAKNVPVLKYKLRFSSDGAEGAWDISTMSMRGVSSCQSWGSGNHTHIVGSIVDPFTGILYLTSGGKFNEYGSKMIRRCVVRFVVDEKKGTPFIALERMYPAMERGALDAFTNFIKERTDKKFDVIYLPESRKQSVYVPISKVVSSLGAQDQPYRDSGMAYKNDHFDPTARIKEQVSAKLERFYSSFPAKVIAAARAMKIGGVPAESKNAFKALRGSDYRWDSSYNLYQALQSDITRFFQKIKLEAYTDSDALIKDGIEGFLADNLEEKIFGICKIVAKRNIRKELGKIDDLTLRELSKVATEKVKAYFETELGKIKIIEKKPGEVIDPVIPIYTKLLS